MTSIAASLVPVASGNAPAKLSEVVPVVRHRGSLTHNQENDPFLEATSSAQCRFRVQVGLDALKGVEPVHTIAAKHGMHPVQVSQ